MRRLYALVDIHIVRAFCDEVCGRRHFGGYPVNARDERLFDAARFVPAVFAAYRRVRAAPEPLGVLCVNDLPPHHDDKRREQQAPAEEAADEQHGGVHHHVTPVEDAAVHAAAVAHHVFLEWAEKHHADKVGKEVKACEQYKLGVSDDVQQIQYAENRIEAQPYERHAPRADVHRLHVFKKLQPIVAASRLRVCMAAAFHLAHRYLYLRNKMQQHAAHQDHPQDVHRRKVRKKRTLDNVRQYLPAENVRREYRKENNGPCREPPYI